MPDIEWFQPPYSFPEYQKISQYNVCADCHGRLLADPIPGYSPPLRWRIRCFDRNCKSTGFISKRYLAVVETNRWADGREVQIKHRELIESESKKMPIPMSVNTVPTHRELGVIRKGIQITQTRTKTVQGKKEEYQVSYPKETPYFVLRFHESESEAAAVFCSEYGAEPTSIKIVPPFDEIDRFWDAWFKAYKGGRMIAKAGLNPALAQVHGFDPHETVFFERLFDVAKNTWKVKRWKNLETGHPEVADMSMNVDPRNGEGRGPMIYSTQKDDYYMSPVGTLRVMVRELVPFQGYCTLHTTGKVDIFNISGELAGLELRAKQSGIPLHQFPMVLSRRKESGRDPDGNATQHWNCHVGLDPEFSEKIYQRMRLETDRTLDIFIEGGPERMALPESTSVDTEILDGEMSEEYFDELPEEAQGEAVEAVEVPDPAESEVVETAEYIPDKWDQTGIARTIEDYRWISKKAGADKETANSIWRECGKDDSKAYDIFLTNWRGALGLAEIK